MDPNCRIHLAKALVTSHAVLATAAVDAVHIAAAAVNGKESGGRKRG
jgi:hypothetical protein